jgi:lysozyme
MRTSQAGVDLIKEFEGLRLAAYKCPAGVWTIGYGHTSMAGRPDVRQGMRINKKQAEDILRDDLTQYEDGVLRLVNIPLRQHQFDVLVSFAFNCGVGALQKSTLLKRVNAKRFDDVPGELMKWTRAGGRELPGLVRRRRAEAAMWRGLGDSKPSNVQEARLTPEEPPAKSITQSKEANAAVAVGAGGAAALAAEVAPIAQQGVGLLGAFSEALGRPAVIGLVIAIGISVAIWWWRKKRLEEHGI